MNVDPATNWDEDDWDDELSGDELAAFERETAIARATVMPALPALQTHVIWYDLTVAQIAPIAGLSYADVQACLTGKRIMTERETHDIACAINLLVGLFELRCLRGCCLPWPWGDANRVNGSIDELWQPCPHADNSHGVCRWDRPATRRAASDGPSMRDRLLARFRADVGAWLTADQQTEAHGGVDYQRSRRELGKLGWPIEVNRRSGAARLVEDVCHPPIGLDPRRGVPPRMRLAVLERDGGRCRLCGVGRGEPALDGKPARIEPDHIIPWSRGGQTSLENLQSLCHVCNHDKQDHVFDPFDPTTWGA